LTAVAVCLALSTSVPTRAIEETGRRELGLALRRLSTAATFMMATAHPDDENNAVLALLDRGMGVRTVLATATRGDGGQNEIGPELFDALAALRTEELLAAHRIDGAEQYFTRAVDFGYSFSVEETFEKWGRDDILGDFVRLIRMTRPDVIVTMRPDGAGGGQHHQAASRLAREAFRAAGDPGKYAEQLEEGLRPWQPKKFYFMLRWGMRGEPAPEAGRRALQVETDRFDNLLGLTYAELGSEARGMHKCQGMSQLLVLPGQVGSPSYELVDAADPSLIGRPEQSFFDGLDVSLEGISRYAPPTRDGLKTIAEHVRVAQAAFEAGRDADVVRALVSGLEAVRELRRALPALHLPDAGGYEVDFRLVLKEQAFQEALVIAHNLRIELLADDGLVVGGQSAAVDIHVANRSSHPVQVKSIALQGVSDSPNPPCAGQLTNGNGPGRLSCRQTISVPADLPLTDVYWRRLPDFARYEFEPDVPFGLPFGPSPFRARLDLVLSGAEVTLDRPLEHRYEGTIFSGEKRMSLAVVPRLAVSLQPEIAIIPTGQQASELRVKVTNGAKGATTGDVRIHAPEGWRVEPASAPLALTREDESHTVLFTLSPPPGVKPGAYDVRAVASAAGATFDRGYEVVEYPHTRRRHLIHEAITTVKVLDVQVAPGLTVGYVMGVGDQVPAAIDQLGVTLVMLGPDDLASGDLSRFDAIVIGVRAYERRPDLRAYNERLIEYARQGGTVLVQYNKFEFNQAQYGPFPAKVSSNRVADEHSPVRVLVPDHPMFTTPNRIDEETWAGWVQERGLYFLGDKDPKYIDLVELQDPFQYNAGPRRGALVEARVGQGRWIYLGLGLWRQLPAGTPGAYALLANLISN
jgi:LmbE family N-acetylglucosaminyl deacetylase